MPIEPVVVMLELDAELGERLRAAARRAGRSVESFVEKAVEASLELDEWQIEEIKKGLREADDGKFATDEEVAAAFGKYGVVVAPNR